MRWGLPILLVMACGTPEAGRSPASLPDVPVQRSLRDGSLLILGPIELVRSGDFEQAFADGLMRVAMAQSVRFDTAPKADGVAGDLYVGFYADPQARVLTTTLLEPGQGPIPLAQASYTDRGLPAAVDALALASRQALGEDLASAPRAVPTALAYSGIARCVQSTEQALELVLRGDVSAAERRLREARSLDGGSPVVLDAIARLQAITGQTREAMRTANEGLSYEQRLAPTSRHRLARTQLQAQASLEPPRGIQPQDQALLALADVTLRERPHDPQALYSRALALNFLSRFDESVLLLRRLNARFPRNATVNYHLAFAELGTEHFSAAVTAIAGTAGKLPRQVTAVPEALALYHADRQEEVRALLDELAELRQAPSDITQHEILRMKAAHAILTDRRDDAVRALVEDMEWMRQRPSILELLTLDLVEDGEVLLRLGATQELRKIIVGLQDLRHGTPTFAQGMVYLGGILQVQETGRHASVAEATLAREEKPVWGNALKAMGHRLRGELLEEASALVHATRYTDSALIWTTLAVAWRRMGREQEAQVLLDELRGKLLSLQMRMPIPHPLLNPARALAYTAVR